MLPADDPGEWTLLGKINPTKQASMLGGAIGGGMLSGTKNILNQSSQTDSTEDLVSQQLLELQDPEHEAALKQIQTQTMLADLMNNDEVIGGYDPQQISEAYNELSMLAPRAMAQPMAVRALLRRQLQGNVEPFEVADTAKLESDVMKTDSPVDASNPLIAGGPIKSGPQIKTSNHWLFDETSIL